MKKILARFRLKTEIEDFPEVIKNIESGVVFRGTNLWVLIFAIFVASLGLNVNSTAVIIGAMLISPLMGPIIGMPGSWYTRPCPLKKSSTQLFICCCSEPFNIYRVFFAVADR